MPPKPLTSAQKLSAASHLYWSARRLKASAVRRTHPDWDADRIQREVRRIFMLSPGLSR